MTRFVGRVRSGKGSHSKLVIPGKGDWHDAPPHWPSAFHPGSLNVGIIEDGYPPGFTDPDKGGVGVTPLDDGVIEPTAVLPWDKIANNGLRPQRGKPRRGTGQFWPARISVIATGDSKDCWVFRRIGSTIKRQLEIVCSEFLTAPNSTTTFAGRAAGFPQAAGVLLGPLRKNLGVEVGTEVAVDVFGKDEVRQFRGATSP